MDNAERIEAKGELIAIVLRKGLELNDGISFFSPPDFPQQLGLIARKKDYVIKTHLHKLIKRNILITQEVLHMVSGRIEVSLYDKDKKKIEVVVLDEGDTILFANGGHGIKFLQDSKILEVKQGPYSGVDNEKERF